MRTGARYSKHLVLSIVFARNFASLWISEFGRASPAQAPRNLAFQLCLIPKLLASICYGRKSENVSSLYRGIARSCLTSLRADQSVCESGSPAPDRRDMGRLLALFSPRVLDT